MAFGALTSRLTVLATDQWRDLTLVGLMALLGAIFYVAPWPVLYLPALLAIALLAWVRLELALVLVPLFVPYFMQPKHIGSKQFAPSEIFLLLDLAIALVYLLLPRKRAALSWRRLWQSPFLYAAILFLVAATISTAFAVDRHQALQKYRELIVEPLAFFALLLLLCRSRWSWQLLFGGLVAAGLTVAVIGLIQYGMHEHVTKVPGTSLERIRAVYGSPDNIGLLYDRVVPIWFAVAALVSLSLIKRVGLWLVGALLLVALFLTFSRGAWFAIAVGCLFVIVPAFSWGRWLAAAAVAIALAAIIFQGPRVLHAFRSGHANTVQRRVHLWKSSLRMIRDHPILGVGPDNFLHYYAPKHQLYIPCKRGLGYMDPAAAAEPCLSHPHNEILDFWLSTGVAGLIAFIWLQVVFWKSSLNSWFEQRRAVRSTNSQLTSQGNPVLLVGVMAAMLAALIHGLVDNSYFLGDLAIAFWLLCAFVSFLKTDGFSMKALSS